MASPTSWPSRASPPRRRAWSATPADPRRFWAISVGRSAQFAQFGGEPAEHSAVRTTPPPLRRRVEGRAAALAEEVRALADRSTDLLARIDELCTASTGSGPAR